MAPVEIQVEVVFAAGPQHVERRKLGLPAGATVADALQASGMSGEVSADAAGEPLLGVWGRSCRADTLLIDGDRVELYRELLVDPKEARRRRGQQRDGQRGRRAAGTDPPPPVRR